MEKTALETQIGGNHYKKYDYEPIEFFMDHQFNAALIYAMKYVSRYPDKNPDDLEKALHCLDIYMDYIKDKLDKNIWYNIHIPTLEEAVKFTSQCEPVVANALISIIACNTNYYALIPEAEGEFDPDMELLPKPDYKKLVTNVTKAKVAIMEMQKHYETRT